MLTSSAPVSFPGLSTSLVDSLISQSPYAVGDKVTIWGADVASEVPPPHMQQPTFAGSGKLPKLVSQLGPGSPVSVNGQ